MAYDEGQVRELAQALLGAVDAVRDGLGPEDAAAGVSLLTALSAAADEARDTDAFALHLISELADVIGDRRVNSEDPSA